MYPDEFIVGPEGNHDPSDWSGQGQWPDDRSARHSTRGGRRRWGTAVGIAAVLATLAAAVSVYATIGNAAVQNAAQAANPNCTLIVPANPLSAAGLATPYQLTATNAKNGPCNEANAAQSAFVQGAIIDANGAITLYDPLVIDKGTKPLAAPAAATVPAGSTVALWFGFNGQNLTLMNPDGAKALKQGKCVNGSKKSVFGEFAYCNAPAFFTAANAAIQAGQLQVPALAMANDGKPCPSVRSFSIVDQDQSDNVLANYLANGNGQTGQNNAATRAALQAMAAQNANGKVTAQQQQTAQQAQANEFAARRLAQQGQAPAKPAAAANAGPVNLANASDNRLLSVFVLPALGCQPWMAPNQSMDNMPSSSLPLNELQAAAGQQAPIALVPLNDPMTMVNMQQSQTKTNLYRAGVDQMPIGAADNGNGTTYCQNIFQNPAGIQRIFQDMAMLQNAASPDPAAATNLFTFLAMRGSQTFTNLGCMNLLNIPNPIQLTMNGAMVTAATFKPAAAANANGMNANGMNAGNGMNANGMNANGMNAGNAAASPSMSAMPNGGMNNGGMNNGGMNAGNGAPAPTITIVPNGGGANGTGGIIWIP